ncbi:hypothetical protein [Rhizobium gallicum]|uniref:hypothetical protein n=1 Tax=Rhizobium gallicum TaxID=56730 RepID=UPI001EF8DC02|nr:hypothetical protein [Rhizobium gallicum]ULJ74393.1 hypothetical protein L2W42_21160 [Rhizobium gallicum]
MRNAPIDDPCDDEQSGTYWTPPARTTLAEISPLLMARVLMTDGYAQFLLYSACAFDMASGGPVGVFHVAIDETGGRAIGIYDGDMERPKTFAFRGDADAAIEALYAIAKAEGYVL